MKKKVIKKIQIKNESDNKKLSDEKKFKKIIIMKNKMMIYIKLILIILL